MRRLMPSFLLAALAAGASLAATTIDTTNKWMWSAGAGWINCRTDTTNGVAVGEYVLAGYGYSSTAGWISFGDGTPTNGLYYVNNSATDYGVNHDGKGHLTGYAWCESAGWINFGWTNNPDATRAPKVNLQNGIFSGYVWGGSLGWISLSNLSARLQAATFAAPADADGDGMPDAWEIEQTGRTNSTLSSTNDADHDGESDYQEYVTDTNPTNNLDYLGLQNVLLTGGTNLQLTWSGRDTRLYYIDRKTNLLEAYWTSNVLGPVLGSSTTTTVQTISATHTQGFFRIRAALPRQ